MQQTTGMPSSMPHKYTIRQIWRQSRNQMQHAGSCSNGMFCLCNMWKCLTPSHKEHRLCVWCRLQGHWLRSHWLWLLDQFRRAVIEALFSVSVWKTWSSASCFWCTHTNFTHKTLHRGISVATLSLKMFFMPREILLQLAFKPQFNKGKLVPENNFAKC